MENMYRVPLINLTDEEQNEFEKILSEQRNLQLQKILLSEEARLKRVVAKRSQKKIAVEALAAIAFSNRHVRSNAKKRIKFEIFGQVFGAWLSVCPDPERYRTSKELSAEIMPIIEEFFPGFPYKLNAAGMGAHISSLREYYETTYGMKTKIERCPVSHRDHYLFSFAPIAQRTEQLPSKQ